MVTIKDIAEECNVSITTVSNVLNGKAKVGEKTKQRILEVIEKRGYRPNTIAQGLRSQKTKNIAIIAVRCLRSLLHRAASRHRF